MAVLALEVRLLSDDLLSCKPGSHSLIAVSLHMGFSVWRAVLPLAFLPVEALQLEPVLRELFSEGLQEMPRCV